MDHSYIINKDIYETKQTKLDKKLYNEFVQKQIADSFNDQLSIEKPIHKPYCINDCNTLSCIHDINCNTCKKKSNNRCQICNKCQNCYKYKLQMAQIARAFN